MPAQLKILQISTDLLVTFPLYSHIFYNNIFVSPAICHQSPVTLETNSCTSIRFKAYENTIYILLEVHRELPPRLGDDRRKLNGCWRGEGIYSWKFTVNFHLPTMGQGS